MRFTKIIATIGPASNSLEAITQFSKLGVNICRLNFSHGDYKNHKKTIEIIRTINRKGGALAIMIDTKGPEVRTGDSVQAIKIRKGDRVIFTSKPTGKEKLKTVTVDYDKFADDVQSARCILIDNGSIEFRLDKIEKNGSVIAVALEDGSIGSRRHVNLPGAHISLPSFTPKDLADIKFGIEQNADFFATSFVRSAKDIAELRNILKKNNSTGEIIAKIETPQAVEDIDDIIDAADGIMVARGDLGAEVPFEDVPRLQEMIVAKCRVRGKPVIVATHMLESMILSPMPTRAEVTDIAYAAKLQADATMLSGETAGGMYPMKAVAAMDKILRASERVEPDFEHLFHHFHSPAGLNDIHHPKREQALAACILAARLSADAILVITRTGGTAMAVSNCRPLIPIHAFTDTETRERQMMMLWGVIPHHIPFSLDREQTLLTALDLARKEKFLKKDQRIVVVSDIQTDTRSVMTIQIRTID
ncbi:pyruvate kinase [Candidatus Peribacteria bacterium RIFCSPHIGHO2_02_FULL_51_15]|nr:MAG: pyruvate kinase [Candidatus Peribacteria bacterium RIFCSPHIGHO2_02_FULL_51_15]